MTLAPLLASGPIIVTHVVVALAAFGLGTAQMLMPKGTRTHRLIGWAWVVLMGIVAVGSFGIHTIRQVGPFSFIHIISLFTIGMLILGVLHARTHRIASHKGTMIGLYVGALVITGLLTLLPGRIMYRVVFGG